jgi:hypothetical protein
MMFCEKFFKPVKNIIAKCSTSSDYFNLVFVGIILLGVLFLFAFLFFQIFSGLFVSSKSFEDWEEECKKKGYNIETGTATYMGTYYDNMYWACFLIQSNTGEKIFLDRNTLDLMPHGSIWNWHSYEGLSYPIKYITGHPEIHWIFFEQPLHYDPPIQSTHGYIKKVVRIHHLVRIQLSFQMESYNGKETIFVQQYLPSKYSKLCRKLKKGKIPVPIKIYEYIYNKNLCINNSIPCSDAIPSIIPTLGFISHQDHPWIANIDLDGYESPEK